MSTEEKAHVPEDIEALKECLLLVEQKFGMGTHLTWTESSYKVLSGLIEAAAKSQVSTNTLRRLYDKVLEGDGAYSPKVGTKNALAVFIGFEDWYHFVTRNNAVATPAYKPSSEVVEQPALPESQPNGAAEVTSPAGQSAASYKAEAALTFEQKHPRQAFSNKAIGTGILVFIAAAVLWGWLGNRQDLPVRKAKLIELSNPSEKASLPFAHDFRVEYQGYNPDSLNLESHEGPMGTVSGTNNYFSTRYLVPGPYVVKLRNGSQLLDYKLTVIKSKGWQRLVSTSETAFNYPENMTIHDAMGFEPSEVKSIAMRMKHKLKVMYLNFGELDFPVDAFRLETRTKITSLVNDMDCYSTKVKVMGDSGQFNFCTSRLGCGNLVYCSASDTFVNGNIQPLPQLAVADTWHDVVMEVKDKVMTCWLDGKEVLQLPYRKPGGKLLGVSIIFEGDGKAEYIRIKNQRGELLHEKNFAEQK